MPRIVVDSEQEFDVEAGVKLVLCLEDNGIDVLHRCGGNARCTTCRVEILEGHVPPMSDAEREALEEPELIAKYRLACQIRVESDLTVRPALRSHSAGMAPGPRPKP